MGAAGSQRSDDVTSDPSKGKEKVVPYRPAPKVGTCTASSDAEMSYEDTIPLVRRMRLVHSDGSSVDGLLLSRQQAPAPQPIPKAAVLTVQAGPVVVDLSQQLRRPQ
jgi:hypothetical protein